jgi:hypothetical protein
LIASSPVLVGGSHGTLEREVVVGVVVGDGVDLVIDGERGRIWATANAVTMRARAESAIIFFTECSFGTK